VRNGNHVPLDAASYECPPHHPPPGVSPTAARSLTSVIARLATACAKGFQVVLTIGN